MESLKFAVTPTELVAFHRCLSSKICVRVFKTLLADKTLNISAISRKAKCTRRDAIKHLKNLVKLGIVHEEFYAGVHTFALKSGEFTKLMQQAVEVMEQGEGD